jgi:hypothetical protein
VFFQSTIADLGSMNWITPYPSPQIQPNFPQYREYQQFGISPRDGPLSLIPLAKFSAPDPQSDNGSRHILLSLHRKYVGGRSSSPSSLAVCGADFDSPTFRSPRGTSEFPLAVRLVVGSTILYGDLGRFRSCEVIRSYRTAHSLVLSCKDICFPVVISLFFLSDALISRHPAVVQQPTLDVLSQPSACSGSKADRL